MVVKAQDHCSTCRSRPGQNDVNFVQQVLGDCRGDDTKLAEGVAPELGSKMAKIVETLWQVRQEEKGAKIIMFCQWEYTARYLGHHRTVPNFNTFNGGMQ